MKSLLKNHWPILTTLLAFFLFVTTSLLFYPGYMSPDSIWQLCQTLDDCQLDSWHPVSMVLVWKVLYTLSGDKIGSMLIFQMLMFWSSIAIISFYLWKKTKRRLYSIAPFAIALLPNIIGLSGVIWKDLQMAYALLLSVSLILLIRIYKHKRRLVWTLASASLILIAYAITVRTNAVAAALPIVFALIYSLDITKKTWGIAGSAVFLSGAFFLINPAINTLAKSQITQSHAQTTMYIYDIISIQPRQKILDTAPGNIKDVLDKSSSCSYLNTTPSRTELEYWKCVDAGEIQSLSLNGQRYASLKSYWKSSVISHPFRYTFGKILTSFKFLFPDKSQFITNYGILPGNTYGLNPKILASVSINNSYTMDFGYQSFPFLFQGWFWLSASLITMLYGIFKVRRNKWIIVSLSTSSLLNILSLLPGSLTPDYRYIYWSSLSLLFALLLTIVSHRSHRNKR